MEKQKLLSNKDLMLKNFTEVIENLRSAEQYIQLVLVSAAKLSLQDKVKPSDPELARLLEDCMGQFSSDETSLLENVIASNFEDALMISSLSKLQQHQLRLSEKINNIFAESISKQTPSTTLTKSSKNAPAQKWTQSAGSLRPNAPLIDFARSWPICAISFRSKASPILVSTLRPVTKGRMLLNSARNQIKVRKHYCICL